MSRAADVTIGFGGEDRLFRLPLGRLRALQEKTDAGPPELLRRMVSQNWRIDDVRETIFQGLLGGGMSNLEATRLVQMTVDEEPLGQFVIVAQAVLMAAIVGTEDEELGEQEGEEVQNRSPAENSGSQTSTEPAQR